jgi:hypothetical protein
VGEPDRAVAGGGPSGLAAARDGLRQDLAPAVSGGGQSSGFPGPSATTTVPAERGAGDQPPNPPVLQVAPSAVTAKPLVPGRDSSQARARSPMA